MTLHPSQENKSPISFNSEKDLERYRDYAFLVRYARWWGNLLDRRISSHSSRATTLGTLIFLYFSRFSHTVLFTRWGGLTLPVLFAISVIISSSAMYAYGTTCLSIGCGEGFLFLMDSRPLVVLFPFLLYILIVIPVCTCMILAEVPSVRENLQGLGGPLLLKERGFNSLHRSAEQLDSVFKNYLLAALLLLVVTISLSALLSIWGDAAQIALLEAQAVQQTLETARDIGVDAQISADDTMDEAM